MAKKHHHDSPDHTGDIIAAALALAAERGWRAMSLAEIAGRAGMKLADLVENTPTKTAILDAYTQRIDRSMMESKTDIAEPIRDRLFDVLMRRFEAMAPDRAGLSAILRGTGDDPWALACGARRLCASMALALETAGISSSGLGGMARVQALAMIYLVVLRTFADDDSADLARTMAALDKALRRAEGVAAMVWRRRDNGPGQQAQSQA